MANTTYLESKPRYEILDGLRGVGALIVVAFHLFETYSNGILNQKLNHGYLAVDFFFLLSGFVISYAYDDRWDRMTLGGFFKRRIVRLHPMLIMGTCIARTNHFHQRFGVRVSHRYCIRLPQTLRSATARMVKKTLADEEIKRIDYALFAMMSLKEILVDIVIFGNISLV